MEPKQSESWIWWKHGVLYHIYPRSFMDSNGDGIGDLQGIISKLDYLSSLGVDGIWLSPVYLSPMVDFGYDVSDYRKTDPVFGTLEDFKMLISKAHDIGIRVISDMILNHTSNQHPWFQESRSSNDNSKRNWYIWKDGYEGVPPNNWKSAVGGSAWEFDKITGQYYYHSFFKEQPDLNWRNPELAEAFYKELKFWLELGVDGFRLDVINFIAKDKKFRDNPYLWGIPLLQRHLFTRNRSKSLKIVRELRKLVDQYENRVLIGEIYTMPPGNSKIASNYLADGKGIHMAFDFSLIFRSWIANKYSRCIREGYRHIPEKGWPCIVLSNHDLFRSIDRFPWRRHIEEKAKVAAALLLTLKGTPFIYYGEEIGMRNGRIRRGDIQDPLGKRFWPFFTGRDKARTPMQWNSGKNGGFSTVKPWLPANADNMQRNVEIQEKEESSLLNFYRILIKIRKENLPLQQGQWVPMITGRNGILVYARILGEERIVVVLNFTGRKKRMVLPEHSSGQVLFSTHRKEYEIYYFQNPWIYPFEVSVFKA
jgi:alpha-glucosidase